MRPSQSEFLRDVLLGEDDAIEFCQLVGGLSQTIDDLVDDPAAVARWDVMRAFHIALFDLPENAFYRRNESELAPLLRNAYVAWMDSVELETGQLLHGRLLAYYLRDKLTDIVVWCAYHVGGFEHGRAMGPFCRQIFMDEPLDEFLREHSRG